MRSARHFCVTVLQVLQLLLDRGAQMECRNVFGFTPLLEAVVHSRASAVKLLIAYGADFQMNAPPDTWGLDLSLEVKEVLDVSLAP